MAIFSGSVWDGTSSPLLNQVYSRHSYLSTTTPSAYVPFSFFSMIHATRIACAYRGAARRGGYDQQLGNLQAALVPLVLILGGTTVTGILMGQIPGWLISPIPVLTYGLLPLLASHTGLVSFLLSLPALPRELFFSTVDGFSRTVGITTFGVDAVLTHSNTALRNSPWAMIVVATIAGGGGGMIIPTFNMFGPEWGYTKTPSWVKDGPGIDIWGATLVGIVYATLIDAHPMFRIVPNYLVGTIPGLSHFLHLPKSYLKMKSATPLLPANEAKIFCSLLLAFMLQIRVLWPLVSQKRAPKSRKAVANAKASSAIVAKKSNANLREKKIQ